MINKVILLGNVGQDPEIRTLESGVKSARIRLATTERIFNRQTNETTEHTEWHSVTLWRGLADVADKYVRKGSQLYIEGRIRYRDWEKDGVKHYGVDIIADDMKLLGRRQEGAAPQMSQPMAGGYQQPQQPQYQQPQYQQPQYQQPQQPQYQSSVPMPAAPAMPQDDAEDLPF